MRSQHFDDIYFSAEDGLAETRHVFLSGNGLPDAWHGCARFCICETGFGTGLNMLAAWKLFEDTADAGARLDLVSIEKYPLTPAQIREALAPWADELGVYIERLLAVYPMRIAGFHRLDLSARVSLTLIFDDVHRALPELDAGVDAWFLDGFAPAKNPDMWAPDLYAQMVRLSRGGARVATFTAAGLVRRGLADAGFAIEKVKGYGRKRDMVVGHFTGTGRDDTASGPLRVAVVGAGIAGLSAAWHLQRAGCAVRVYEAANDVATGGSGNLWGLINPKLTAQRSAVSDYYASAYAYALRVAASLPDVDFAPHGSLHLETSADKARRFAGYHDNLGWDTAHIVPVDAAQASDIAGVSVPAGGVFYPEAAAIGPRRVCQALAAQLDVVTGYDITDVNTLDADVVVVANAAAVTRFMPELPIGTVRGQVSLVTSCAASRNLRTNLCYGGYLTPFRVMDDVHVCGATFQPWGTSCDVLEEDHIHNLETLWKAVPVLANGGMRAVGGRASFRAASRDRLPIVGKAADNKVFLSVAHGSHGIISGLMAGAIAAAQLCGGPLPVAASALAALSPSRFRKGDGQTGK